MQFFILTAILCAIFASFTAEEFSAPYAPIASIWLTVGLPCLLPGIVSALLCARSRQGKPQDNSRFNDLEFAEKLGTMIWFVVTVLICFATSWGVFTSQVSPFTTISTCLFLSPILFSIVSVWLVLSIASQSSLNPMSLIHGFQQIWLQFKLQLLTILIPLGMLMVAHDVAKFGSVSNPLFDPNSQSAFGDLTFFILPTVMFLVICLMPKILCWILPTRSISETELGRQLLMLANESGAWIRDVKIWNTGNRVMNGLVVGLLPFGRQILLTDRLIQFMDANQIAAVFLHEIGHAKRNHMLIRFLAVSLPMASHYFLLTSMGLSDVMAILFSILITGAIFGWVARLLEFDADQFASMQMIRLSGSNQSCIQSLEIIQADQPKSDRLSWLHPSISTRIKRLIAQTPAPVSIVESAHVGYVRER